MHDDVIKWKHLPRYWPFVQGIHRSPVNSRTKASDAELWCIFFDLHLNERLSKQSQGCWFETQWCSLWRHSNGIGIVHGMLYCWTKYLKGFSNLSDKPWGKVSISPWTEQYHLQCTNCSFSKNWPSSGYYIASLGWEWKNEKCTKLYVVSFRSYTHGRF